MPRGRGRPKRTIQRTYDEQIREQVLAFEAPTDIDHKHSEVEKSDHRKLDNLKLTRIYDSVTRRDFGDLETPSGGDLEISVNNMIRKTIQQQQSSLHGDGDEIFRLMVNSSEVAANFTISSSDEPNYRDALIGPNRL